MCSQSRLHPAFMLIAFLSSLKETIVPLLFLTITALRNSSFEWWNILGIGAILFFTVTSSFLRWLRFHYEVTDREIRIEYGLFVRKRRFIPFERIQSLHLTQGIIHRLFGLVKFQIETAGGNVEPEAQLSALTREQAEHIREWIRKQDQNDDTVTERHEELEAVEDIEYEFKLPKKALLIVASTSGKFGILFSFIAAILSQIDELLPEQFFESIYNALISSSILFVSAIVLFVAIIAWIVSFITTLLRFGGFTLTKKQDDLVISRGLLEKQQLTVPLNKVQAVRIDEGLLRQPFHYAMISVEIAGDSGQDQDQSTIIHPLIKTSEVYPFLQKVLPTFVEDYPFQSVPKRARRRYVIRNSWFLTIPIGVAFWFLPVNYALLTIGLLLFGILIGLLKHKDAGWFLSNKLVGVRFRKIKRTTVLTLKKRVQSFDHHQSLFQKRNQLASFQFAVLGGLFGNTYTIEDMDVKKADELFHQLRL